MEVKIVQCPNGHYYNAAIHSVCPECGGRGGNVQHTVAAPAATAELNHTIAANDAGYTVDNSFNKTVSVDSGYTGGVTIPVTPNSSEGSRFGATVSADSVEGAAVAEPVVGWLVCIEGGAKGCEFRIHAGYNYIGRETGDIRILGDMQISREGHAMIAYDPVSQSFFFGPSGGRNFVYLNGKTVFSAMEVHNYDVITVGSSKLLFLGLCGERFTWEKGVTGGNG